MLTIAQNHLGGKDAIATQYDFTGQVLKTVHKHYTSSQAAVYTTKTFEYDHAGRLLQTWQKIGTDLQHTGDKEVLIAENRYNEKGELINKGLYSDENNDGNFMQEMNYTYNIRGWLTSINDLADFVNYETNDVFAMELYYNTTSANNPQYNGNISMIQYTNIDIEDYISNMEYNFKYDELNRLTDADFIDHFELGYSNEDIFSVNSIRYDVNGNIRSLTRRGNSGTDLTPYNGTIDMLTYRYAQNSNQLKGVKDIAGDVAGRGDFYDGKGGYTTDEYEYDANGNTISDANSGITSVEYNTLNLPKKVTGIETNSYNHDYNHYDPIGIDAYTQTYTYDAAGNKLSARTYIAGIADIKTDYTGSFVYEQGFLKRILFEVGVIEVDQVINEAQVTLYEYQYNYFIKDHLGNTRVVCKPDSEGNTMKTKPIVHQRNDYYPFGMLHGGKDNQQQETNDNHYLYNGKEAQARKFNNFGVDYITGLAWLDYGARFYDAALGRWTSVDPLAEKYVAWSPYNYVAGNPIRMIDPDGRRNINFDENGNYTETTQDKWFHNFFVGNRGRILDSDGDVTQKFRFADPENDVADIQSGKIKRIELVSEDDVQLMVSRAGGFDAENKTENTNYSERYVYIKREAEGGGRMDFSYTQIKRVYPDASKDPLKKPSEMIFLVGGMAHNHMNFGNFLYGSSGQAMGFKHIELRMGAHYNSLTNPEKNGYKRQLDSRDDQRSIKQGFGFAKDRNYNALQWRVTAGPLIIGSK